MENDLSDYEKLRLENIKRNASLLAELGFKPLEKKSAAKFVQSNKRKRRESCSARPIILPIRRSPRLHKVQEFREKGEEEESEREIEKEDGVVDYEKMPFDSEELDDDEFQVFVELKAWRLNKSRELDIEPYKICQNRTLAELVRRLRNNDHWAVLTKEDREVEKDLLECWGIGPSKARREGFGALLVEACSSNTTAQRHLAQSRLRSGRQTEGD
eukprot:gene7622-8423_t